jgi:CxxC-x17-CxxC domain-containing protein
MTYGSGGFGGSRGGFGRDRGSSGGGFRRSFGPREMHKIICAECKQEGEVPFKPREGTPVYCRDCFNKRKGMESTGPSAPKKEAAAVDAEEAETEEVEDSKDF